MSKCRYYLIFVLFCITGGSSQNKAFEVPDYLGEIMLYKLKYGVFTIGKASISCLSDSMDCSIRIKAVAKTTGWVKLFRDLNYRFESCMNDSTGLPKAAIRSLKDGKYEVYNELIFDRISNSDSTIVVSQLSGKHVVPKNIYDILTGFFHFRKNFLYDSTTRSEDVVIKTYFTDELWDLRIRYSGQERVKTNYGELLCDKFNPVTVVGRYFHNDNDMTVWFTKQHNAIPVKIMLNLRIGSITGELDGYQNPKYKLIQPVAD